MSVMASRITGHSSVFVQQFIQANIKQRWKFAKLTPCQENPPAINDFTSQRASNAENVGISVGDAIIMMLIHTELSYKSSVASPDISLRDMLKVLLATIAKLW